MTIRDDMTYEFDGPAALVIVPNYVRDAINAKLDAAITDEPEAAKHREYLYHQLICYFSEYDSLPSFSLKRKTV